MVIAWSAALWLCEDIGCLKGLFNFLPKTAIKALKQEIYLPTIELEHFAVILIVSFN